MRCFATCALYLEPQLADELKQLGAQSIQPTRAGVGFEAELETAYHIVLWSRLASRILQQVATFECPDADALYAGVHAVNWTRIFSPERSFAFSASGGNRNLDHTQFIAQRSKDALVDRFRAERLSRPDVDLNNPDVMINVHVAGDSASVSLDLSGHSLHQRGYRVTGAAAPLKENLAAALLYRADWPRHYARGAAFSDLFCGAGTLVLEAAMMAADMAPSVLGTRFGVDKLKQHEPEIWQELQSEVRARAREGREALRPDFHGSDISQSALTAARKAAHTLGLAGKIQFRQQSFSQARSPADQGLMISNPPWGDRLGDEMGLVGLYHRLGQHLRRHFAHWHVAILTGSETLGRATGLHAADHYTFRHGPLDCQLLLFGQPATQSEPRLEGIDMVRNRLQKNRRRLSPLLKGEDVRCYRLYDADIPAYNAAIDVYEKHIHVQEYQAPGDIPVNTTERRLRELVTAAILEHGCTPDQVHVKVRAPQSGSRQYTRRDDSGNTMQVRESDLKFEVNLDDYLDTGLFLDHRKTRSMIRSMADSKDVLNLFSYTGTVSVYAAKGGARSVTSVDMSRTYMNWARTNFRINHLTLDNYEFVQADVLQWLEETREVYDLIFLDPPTFSNSKRMETTLDIQRDHVSLIESTLRHLRSGGVLLFSTNAGGFSMEFEREGWWVNEITRKTLPLDFHDAKTHHRAWRIEQARS